MNVAPDNISRDEKDDDNTDEEGSGVVTLDLSGGPSVDWMARTRERMYGDGGELPWDEEDTKDEEEMEEKESNGKR